MEFAHSGIEVLGKVNDAIADLTSSILSASKSIFGRLQFDDHTCIISASTNSSEPTISVAEGIVS